MNRTTTHTEAVTVVNNIRRAQNLLVYGDQRTAMVALEASGVSAMDSYLAVKAAITLLKLDAVA
jgi:hypothetical protein